MTATSRIFPLDPGGGAEEAAALLGPRSRLAVEDRTAWPRWGLKGPGSADWLVAHGLALPALNRHAPFGSLTVLRLGRTDITLLADPADSGSLATLCDAWQAASSPKGYESWRQESWAWLALSGAGLEDALRRLTAIDLRPGRFGADAIAQTRFAAVDAVLFRRGASVEIAFDITATACVLKRIASVATSLADSRTQSEDR